MLTSIFFLSAWIILTSCDVDAFSPSSSLVTTTPTNHVSSSMSLSAAAPTSLALFGLAAKRKQHNNNNDVHDMFAIPSIFHASDSRPVVLFDGKCNLCNAGVQLVLDYDRASSDVRGNLRVAALQSRVGKLLLARLPQWQRDKVVAGQGGGGGEYKSIVVTSPTQTWINSAACLRIGRELRGPLRYLAWLAWVIPPFIRDPMYKLLSRHRKKLFGETAECRLWDDRWDTRFVDDAMFGGRGANDDPFADPSVVAAQEENDDDDDVRNVDRAVTPSVGDSVRVVSSKPILHTHVSGYEQQGLCSVGLVGTVTRVLKQQSYPKNVAVMFQLDEDSNNGAATKFEAHFHPWQLRKE